ncbi:bifunctional diaminohydroxyphosphoribosylaminopyrimidine deaminase/5-amino-6-(5-phosphoribosylamino)uracil reductase RibD [Adhaeribacter aquaticus]|uniref:bifunctional diaminohydroxyphosphoribosylaminopyrimidine deaminase/5-amino-6-(5-phosphoribosylamino)uracil reductase RibD n=1 Tax=Adhaeribacter aquaticus TaxID=299567 RepID=UPI0003F4E72A|nr:bifunctional diaminohydroxyphosphoribosylaminopyrimidine deaminase/5-amino-6-(5-phosphoribosylamino)uracil reductase RibD [Adhaeribacter aquaticus]
MTTTDQIFMRRALELAALGRGTTSPNPMVGCVIVHEGKIIGEGWHQQYGGPHAEVNAINSVEDKSLLPASRLFVTLEPCSHYGKTPPCADFLINHGIKDVVICNTDPNPMVKGNGIRKLLEADCQVHVGLLEEEGLELNKYFFTYHTHKRPYITLKWAETADGFIGRQNNSPLWISNKLSKKVVHKWRAEKQAIMVGTRTALVDNPHLNTREWTGKNPLRVILDKNLRLPEHLQIFNQSQPTVIYNYIKQEAEVNREWVKLKEDEPLVENILADLYQRNIQSVLVEGGAALLNSFIKANLWDEAFVFKSSFYLNEPGIAAPNLPLANLKFTNHIATDKLLLYKN